MHRSMDPDRLVEPNLDKYPVSKIWSRLPSRLYLVSLCQSYKQRERGESDRTKSDKYLGSIPLPSVLQLQMSGRNNALQAILHCWFQDRKSSISQPLSKKRYTRSNLFPEIFRIHSLPGHVCAPCNKLSRTIDVLCFLTMTKWQQEKIAFLEGRNSI